MNHDVIVIGAGPAGSTAAIELARQGRSVALIEKAPFPRRKVCGEFLSATTVPVLHNLGIHDAWSDLAGPEVRRVALFAGERIVEAPMPARHGFGRALGRDVLDTLLRDAAVRAGAAVHQPFAATRVRRQDGRHAVTAVSDDGQTVHLHAPVLVAGHGSWQRGRLPTSPSTATGPADMLGFKAHFRAARLPHHTMPLLAFPGGYGGIVWADDGRLSLSCCIRRDTLSALRKERSGSAAQVLDWHLRRSCRGVREVLRSAELAGPWLATGPLRPGVRARFADDVFRIGNVAGEAHPVIAEGIAMAMQSGSLLARSLATADLSDANERAAAGMRYAAAWSRQFALRIRCAQLVAAMAMRPAASGPVAAAVAALPPLLTLGARLSGKARPFAPS